jgi:lysophospholipase
MRDPTQWSGVVLSAPALEGDPKVATPFMKSIAGLLSEVLPKLGLEKLDLNTLSKNRPVVELAVQDPIYPSVRMQARWASEMLIAMDDVWGKIHLASFPFLLLHSREDKICHVNGSRKFFQLAPSKDKHYKEYEQMYHELFTELSRQTVLAEVQRFIMEHSK